MEIEAKQEMQTWDDSTVETCTEKQAAQDLSSLHSTISPQKVVIESQRTIRKRN